MQSVQTEVSDVIYNAAEQAFEALVTLRTPDQQLRYPCRLEACITLSFEDAARSLSEQALRQFRARSKANTYFSRAHLQSTLLRRGLPVGQYGFYRGRAA